MREKREIAVIDFIVVYLSLVSIVNVILLTAGLFNAFYSLLISIALLLVGLLIFRTKVKFEFKKFSLLLIPILLLAIFLRAKPQLYLTGGQDQGTYVSLSKQYEINGSLYMTDEIRETLPKEAQEEYDRGNIFLGVDMMDGDTSTFVMPFYPVFPSWMSIFGPIFGSDNRVYALTFFSILSIVGFYLLSTEVGKGKKGVGLLATFLLAINPLHVYFSRIPTTEIVAVVFMFFGLYYMLRWFYSLKGPRARNWEGFVSLISFNALFYTRMSAVFILPVAVIILLYGFILVKNKATKKVYISYGVTWLLTFIISLFFYKIFLPQLFDQIVGNRFLSYFENPYISVSVIVFSVIFAITMFLQKGRELVGTAMRFIYKKLWLIFLFTIFSLMIYSLYFYVKEVFVEGGIEFLSYESLSALKQQGFLTTVLYLSPLGFVLLVFSVWDRRKTNNLYIGVILLILIGSLLYNWGILRLTQYHYYFARYQLTELIPFGLLLISILLGSMLKRPKLKILSVFLIVLLSIYSLYFSVIQLRDSEGLKIENLEYIEDLVGEDDALIVVRTDFTSFNQIVFPLRYYYGIDVVPMLSPRYLQNDDFKEIKYSHENSYILSTISTFEEGNPKRFELIGEVEFRNNYFVHCFRDQDKYFDMTGHSEDLPLCEYMVIPNRYYYGTYSLYLYRWK
jgi:hypothetical protein